MKPYQVNPIGRIHVNDDDMFIAVSPAYLPGLQALDGFSHLQVFWWFSECDDDQSRRTLTCEKPYTQSPDVMGVFATRSPMRPNPIALSLVQVLDIDYDKGIIRIPYIDAIDGTPLLDIKPYTPSLERVETPGVPAWCAHWPKSMEQSANFDWSGEFNF